jgi:ppGpp synthetase/RelA/SpoT-type nucleotidyltranferase
LDPSNKKKNWYSVADKLWRESQKKTPKYNLQNFHGVMTDLVRLRVACNFLSDIESFESALIKGYESDKKKQKAFLMEKTDDSIKQRPKDRKSGHRSIKYLFTSKDFPGVFLELQIMTLFQEAWDQKDHYLIYERRRQQPDRDSENFPEYEDELVHDMGGSLSVLDTLFNQIKHKLENNHHEDSKTRK